MLNNGFYDHLKTRFEAYVAGFDQTEPARRFGFDLKKEHSFKVAEESASIAGAIGCGPDDIELSRIIGLLHDIGRFKQFARYGTFNDQISVDHGEIGAELVSHGDWLSGLEPVECRVIVVAVRHHNKARLPDLADDRSQLFARLIRDADKLDIFRVLRDIYKGPEFPQAIDLPPGDDLSDGLLKDILEQRAVLYEHIKNRIDAIVFRMAWLVDINFGETLTLIRERGYDLMLRDMLPDTQKIKRALDSVDACVARRIAQPCTCNYPAT